MRRPDAIFAGSAHAAAVCRNTGHRYKLDDRRHVGVMSDDVRKVRPDAVVGSTASMPWRTIERRWHNAAAPMFIFGGRQAAIFAKGTEASSFEIAEALNGPQRAAGALAKD